MILALRRVAIGCERDAQAQVARHERQFRQRHAARRPSRGIVDDDRHVRRVAELCARSPRGRAHRARGSPRAPRARRPGSRASRPPRHRPCRCRHRGSGRRRSLRDAIAAPGAAPNRPPALRGRDVGRRRAARPRMQQQARPVEQHAGIPPRRAAIEDVANFVAELAARDVERGARAIATARERQRRRLLRLADRRRCKARRDRVHARARRDLAQPDGERGRRRDVERARSRARRASARTPRPPSTSDVADRRALRRSRSRWCRAPDRAARSRPAAAAGSRSPPASGASSTSTWRSGTRAAHLDKRRARDRRRSRRASPAARARSPRPPAVRSVARARRDPRRPTCPSTRRATR